MLKIFLGLLSIGMLSLTWAAERVDKSTLSEKALGLLKLNPSVRDAQAQLPGLIFKHPKFLDHANYQTLRYHEVWVEDLRTGAKREWEVYGGGADVHYLPGRNQWSVDTKILLWKSPLNLTGLLSEQTLGTTLAAVLDLGTEVQLAPSDLKIQHKILVADGRATAVYWVRVIPSARVVVLDARTGRALSNFSTRHRSQALPPIVIRTGSLHIARSKLSTAASSTPALAEKFKDYCQVISSNKANRGEPLLITPRKCDLVLETDKPLAGADDPAQRAYQNSNRILDYYLTQHGQYGFDNDRTLAKPIVSITHIGDHFDNAYWDSELEIMAYGDGQGEGKPGSTKDYTLALDIAGHEFTHAIVSHTADLATPGEPGALNEAFADIFGILISRSNNKFANWNIGAQLYDNQDGSSDEVALRSLSDPSHFKTSTLVQGKNAEVPFPKKYSDRLAQGVTDCNDDNDQCEVHANSTIWSHNAYLSVMKLQDLGYDSVTADRMTGQIFFAALTHRLHENSTMKEAATQTLAACADLFTPKDCAAVREAFVKTELLGP